MIVKVQDEDGTTYFSNCSVSFMEDGRCILARFTGDSSTPVLQNALSGEVTVIGGSGHVLERRTIEKVKPDGKNVEGSAGAPDQPRVQPRAKRR